MRNALLNEEDAQFKNKIWNIGMIDINKYLSVFPGSKESNKIWETELNEILLHRMPNRWSRQTYVKGFDCVNIT